MQEVPFVANSQDNLHCVNAVFRMLHQYFFHKDLTWEEIDHLSKAVPGKATWTFVTEMEFAKKGLEVRNIEPVDYERLYKEGVEYLHEAVGEKLADYYISKSNISSVLQYIPEYLKYVHHETQKGSIEDITQYLKDGYLIMAEINLSILNNTPGFDMHMVLIYDQEGDDYILHDPGLPPVPARRVSKEDFQKCYAFEGAGQGISLFGKA